MSLHCSHQQTNRNQVLKMILTIILPVILYATQTRVWIQPSSICRCFRNDRITMCWTIKLNWAKWRDYFSTTRDDIYSFYVSQYTCMAIWVYMRLQLPRRCVTLSGIAPITIISLLLDVISENLFFFSQFKKCFICKCDRRLIRQWIVLVLHNR